MVLATAMSNISVWSRGPGVAYPTHKGFIGRRRGVLLLVLYTVYLATIL